MEAVHHNGTTTSSRVVHVMNVQNIHGLPIAVASDSGARLKRQIRDPPKREAFVTEITI